MTQAKMTTSAQVDSAERVPVYGIPTQMVDSVWPHARAILTPAVKDETDMTLESVYDDLKTGVFHLWIIGNYDAVAVTQLQDRPKRRVAWIQFIAGYDMPTWFDEWLKAVEFYAQAAGCEAIEFSGRKGWLKHAKKHTNYKPTWTVFRRVF